MDLLSAINASSGPAERYLHGRERSIDLKAVEQNCYLQNPAETLVGRSILLLCGDQLTVAVALIALDGVAESILLCPPDIKAAYLPELAQKAGTELIVGSPGLIAEHAALGLPTLAIDPARLTASARPKGNSRETAWLLLTSGTSGIPKIVRHSLAGLTTAMTIGPSVDPPVWSTFYDIRRYGGLQILLRALTGGGSMVLSDADEPVIDFLRRAGQHNVTHISGTPSHWRRAIMSGAANLIDPAYVRMSGEIADQTIIDALKNTYPKASVAHAYASTEAGVGFAVDDGREGFPASLIDNSTGPVDMKIVDGTLRLRSRGLAAGYIGNAVELIDNDGFVDSGDVVERRGDRYFFCGRKGGIINIGGLKVHPEEIEAVINRHDAVQMSIVKGRKSAVTGQIVVADIVVSPHHAARDIAQLKSDIVAHCRSALPSHKVPAILNVVPSLAINKSGKVARSHA
jgi:acyl-coenzyme A synthetase/AMP-(fatty) acid ligase